MCRRRYGYSYFSGTDVSEQCNEGGHKCHQTGSVNSHWHIVMPTISMSAEDKDYAVCFACPSNADFNSETVVGKNGETIGEFCHKFFAGNENCSTEDRMIVL